MDIVIDYSYCELMCVQVEQFAQLSSNEVGVVTQPRKSSSSSSGQQSTVPIAVAITESQATEQVSMKTILEEDGTKKSKVGRPRTKPPKEKTGWHYHLGGVRHARCVFVGSGRSRGWNSVLAQR